MKNLINKFPYLLFLLLVFVVFKNWFSFDLISSGDWNFRFENQIENFTFFPHVWSYVLSNTGSNINFILGLHSYFLVTTLILYKYFNFSWVVIERLLWLWPILFISTSTSWYLFKTIFPENKFALIAPFVFVFNTYFLTLLGGGQMGIAMAYSIAPLVLAFFIKLLDEENFNIRKSIIVGLIASLQLIFDPRVFYMTGVAVFIYFVTVLIEKNWIESYVKKFLNFFTLIVIVFLIHSFWLIPLLLTNRNPIEQLGSAYSSAGIVKFLSFARFEQTISLLHPYWPENIFGKIGFMRSEFLVMPLLAYSCLIFLNKLISLREKRLILFFSLVGLIGAFLAKGANDPFGNIYLFAFDHIPGFILFRDPTKWYLLIVISYSILIPFSIWRISEWLNSINFCYFLKFQFTASSKFLNLKNIFLFLVLSYLFLIIKPAWMGQLNGTYKKQSIPQDYIKLENFLSKDKTYYRTFWVPSYQRFGFKSDIHPPISGQNFIDSYDLYDVTKFLNGEKTQLELQNLAVKYVIVPFDSQGEIFLSDRKYDKIQYLKNIEFLEQIPYLKKIEGFGKIAVFEVPNSKAHFWSDSVELKIDYSYSNPTKYELDIRNAKKGDVVIFSETYDKFWVAMNSEIKINSSEFKINDSGLKLNKFVLPKSGDYTLTVYYALQDWVNRGLIVSIASFMGIIVVLIGLRLKK